MKYEVFISSNQREFEKERQIIKKHFEEDYFLKSFFNPFLFEYSPASGLSPETTFFEKVRKSDVYIGLIGSNYGTVKENGLSATDKNMMLSIYQIKILFSISKIHQLEMKKVKNLF